MNTTPTKRQLDAMLSVYHGKSPYAVPGTDGRYRVRNAGGAASRMIERIADAGWFGGYYTPRGRFVVQHRLTVAGLEALARKHPDLEGFADRMVAARALEAEAAAKEAAEAAEAARLRQQSSIARHAARAAAMREIAQNYQVRLDLSDDQCVAMWMEIVEREHSI